MIKFDKNKIYPEIDIDKQSVIVYEKIINTSKLFEFFGFLIHDKRHVMNNKSKISEFESIFKIIKNTINKPLYRGLFDERHEYVIGKTYVMNRYQSFSESVNVAQNFATNGLIIQINKSKNIFNYGGFLQYALSSSDDESDIMVVNTARYEREYIFNIETKIKILEIKKLGSFTHIIAEQI